jgi:hypothetical protein
MGMPKIDMIQADLLRLMRAPILDESGFLFGEGGWNPVVAFRADCQKMFRLGSWGVEFSPAHGENQQ